MIMTMTTFEHPHSAHDRTPEWRSCCLEIVLGNDPKRQRLDVVYDDDDDDDDDDEEDEEDDDYGCWSTPDCFAINLIDNNSKTNDLKSIAIYDNLDSWMRAAYTLSASIDEVSYMIQSKATLYLSSTDTLNICFNSNNICKGEMVESSNSSTEQYTMTDVDRSILETTVASFAAAMAKQIESLRKTVIVAGDQQLRRMNSTDNIITGSSSNVESNDNIDAATQHWVSGSVRHRAGIAACLMQRLKIEIMDPMTKLQRKKTSMMSNNRKGGGNYLGNEASFIAQNPLRMFHLRTEDSLQQRSLPPAPWEVGEHDAETDREERIQEEEEFLNVYLTEKKASFDSALESVTSNILPPLSVLKFMDLPVVQEQQSNQQYVAQPKPPIFQQQPPPSRTTTKLNNLPLTYHDRREDEEESMEQLQRETAVLLATYQHSDMESVQKVERSMVEITTLLSRFTDLISEQQDSIFVIHDQATKSKENVDQGQNQLVDAADRGEKSKHPMATFIFLSAVLLLLFNWITP
jgi:hypothetical protein